MEASLDTIIEAREEFMVSPSTGGNPTCRTAYFLKPCMKDSACDFLPPPHSMFSGTATSNLAKLPLEVRYNGWLNPQEEWKTWVELMKSKYEYLWIKAGIDQAIKASTFQIHRNDELILALAQRWCSKTNTFIFPWGEATITLEDIKVCGGDYSVLGDPISSPLETHEQKETEEKLVEARRMFNSTKSRKVRHKPWMMHFMKNESQVEHEAFLCYWLSRFVFSGKAIDTILKCVIPIAIHLARGTRIALAPAVLASIYRDLTLLNNNIVIATINLEVTLCAPFQLVQIWALERFPALKPQPQPQQQPHAIEQSQPRMARWHNVKMQKVKNLESILDSAGARNGFLWRPYKNSPSLRLYNEKDMWECDNPSIEIEMQCFGRCLRVSELVGMGCIEEYLPHRVAMQFGMDQDIPGTVATCREDPWVNYSQLVMDTINMCTALCASQPNVTSRYYHWWKQSKLGKEEDTRKCADNSVISISSTEDTRKGSDNSVISISSTEDTRKGSDNSVISISSTEYISQDSSGHVEDDGFNGPPPGFLSEHKVDQVGDSDQGDGLAIKEPLSSFNKYRCFEDEMIGNSARSKDVVRGSKRIIEDVKMEDVVGGEISAKEDVSEAKPNSPFCDTNGVNKEGGGASPRAINTVSVSDIESRILKLQREVATLKAAKFGPKYENIGAKPNLSVS